MPDLRKQCVKMIQKGLSKFLVIHGHRLHTITQRLLPGHIKNNKKIGMEYVNYDKMMQDLKVALLGWPKTVKFANPSTIGTVGELKVLRDDLKSGKCHWQKQSVGQLAARKAELEAQGQTLNKKRKRRADAGKPKGKDNQKKAKTAVMASEST